MENISKSDAKAAGLLRYFTGKSCKNGHVSERYTNCGGCVSCRNEIARQWIANNPDKAAEYELRQVAKNPERVQQRRDAAKRWRERNPEKHREQVKESAKRCADRVAAYNKQWAQENREWLREYRRQERDKDPEKFRELFRNWEVNNPERAAQLRRASKTNRRTRELENGGKCSGDDIAFLADKQNGKCAGCGKKHKKLEVDHILAVKHGGGSHRRNLQLLCRACNRGKSAKDAIVWAQEHGRLL